MSERKQYEALLRSHGNETKFLFAHIFETIPYSERQDRFTIKCEVLHSFDKCAHIIPSPFLLSSKLFLPIDMPLFRISSPLHLAGLVLSICLALTYLAWQRTMKTVLEKQIAEFNFRVDDLNMRIVRRMATYEQVLRGARSLFLVTPTVTRDRFHTYVSSLDLSEHYPGIQGIGYSQVIPPKDLATHVAAMRQAGFADYAVRPEGQRELYTSIVMIEPFDLMNRRAFGFDMYSEPIRRRAMAQARDSGKATMSGKVTLVQEGSGEGQPGFLLYLPLFGKQQLDLSQNRRAELLGWIYAPFRIQDFMAGLQNKQAVELAISIYDGEPSPGSCIYGCAQDPHPTSWQPRIRELDMAGHRWTVKATPLPAFLARTSDNSPRLILWGGSASGILLALLVWALASASKRAQGIAEQMTDELRASHRQIEQDRQRVRLILDHAHDAFIAVDETGKIIEWNLCACHMLGWSTEEIRGQPLLKCIVPTERRVAFANMTAVTPESDAHHERFESEFLHRDGHVVPVEISLSIVRGSHGSQLHVFARDLTQQKQALAHEQRQQKELEAARLALHRTQKLEAVGKLTGGVAHDFNNVLQIISGNIQLLLARPAPEAERTKRLQNTLYAVERGAKLSNQLLAFARRQPLAPVAVNLRRIVQELGDLLRRSIGEEVDMEVSMAGGLWNTFVDPNQLENVILNLAINARDAMQGSGRLTIELGNAFLDEDYVASEPDLRAGQYVMLAMTDTGCGMTAEVLEQAFEPFFTTKPEGEGTGLGLAMAYGFVKQSGGHIRIYSEVGQGTTVKIYLPRHREQEEVLPMKPDLPLIGGNETILVVEDDPVVRVTVIALLEGLGYQVLQASHAAEALSLVEQGVRIDMLFTDVVMPGPLRSTELARLVKQRLPNVAILYTSGYTQNAIVHSGRLDPGVELLSKPYRREQLAHKIRNVLGKRRDTIDNDAA